MDPISLSPLSPPLLSSVLAFCTDRPFPWHFQLLFPAGANRNPEKKSHWPCLGYVFVLATPKVCVTSTTRTKRRCGSPKENQSSATGQRETAARQAQPTDVYQRSQDPLVTWDNPNSNLHTNMERQLPKGEKEKAGQTKQQVSAFVTRRTTRSYFIVAPRNIPSTSQKAHIGKNEPINRCHCFLRQTLSPFLQVPVLCARPARNRRARYWWRWRQRWDAVEVSGSESLICKKRTVGRFSLGEPQSEGPRTREGGDCRSICPDNGHHLALTHVPGAVQSPVAFMWHSYGLEQN